MKLHKIIIALSIVFIFSVNCLASIAVSSNGYVSPDGSITVTFDEDAVLCIDDRDRIALQLIEKHTGQTALTDSGLQTASLMCTLFGHNLETSKSYVVEHEVQVSQPRCLKTTYTIETCTRCEYENMEVASESYIYCCE